MFINNTVSDSAKRALSGFRIGSSGNLERKKTQGPVQPTSAPVQQTSAQVQAPQQTQSRAGLLESAMSQAKNIQSGINNLRASEQKASAPTTPTTTKGLVPPPSYGGLLTDLRSAANPTDQQKGLVTDIRSTAMGNQAIGQDARDTSRMYGDEIARIGGLGAGAQAGALSKGTSVVGAGNAAIASQSASARMNALANANQAQLMGIDKQLTAQNQTVTGLDTALSGANTQQTNLLSGLGTAGGFAQPVQIAPGSTLSSPVTGEQVAGGLGGYVNYQTAEQVMGLISQYPDAGYAYNPSLTPQQNLQNAQAAIQASPTYQKGTYGVPGQNTIAGAAQVQTAQQGFNQATIDYNNLYASFANADSLADNALNIMATAGINPTDVRFANKKIGEVKRQLSSVQQQKFDTALQEARNAFGGIVASYGGSTPTDIGSAYNTLLNPDASFGAVAAAIEQLKEAGRTRLEAEYQKVSTYYSQLPGQQNVGTQTGGSTGSSFAEQW